MSFRVVITKKHRVDEMLKPNNRMEFAPAKPGAGPRCRSAAHAERWAP